MVLAILDFISSYLVIYENNEEVEVSIKCLLVGHWLEIKDKSGLKHCAVCWRVFDGYDDEFLYFNLKGKL